MSEFSTPMFLENCLLELILNSLSSAATAIAVRIDVDKKKIQVVDNGCGISQKFLRYFGESAEVLKKFKSEEKNFSIFEKSLSKIRRFSSFLVIMTRRKNSFDTYGKFFRQGSQPEMKKIENRPTCGTTVTIYDTNNFFNWNWKIDSFAIRRIIIYLALVNSQVSFSIRDDTNQSILLRIGKNQKRRQLLRVICGSELTEDDFFHVKISIEEKIKVEIFWGTERTDKKKCQQVFLNLRPINCPPIKNFMTSMIKKFCRGGKIIREEKIFFLFYIRSPETEYDYLTKDNKKIVKFNEIGKILCTVEDNLRKYYSKFFESRKQLNYKPIIPSLIFRPIDRSFSFKRKKSFFSTNISTKYFKRRNNGSEIKLEEEKIAFGRKGSNFSITGNKNDKNDYIIDVSQLSQKCREKWENGFEKSPLIPRKKDEFSSGKNLKESSCIFEKKNSEENCSTLKKNATDEDNYSIEEKCIEEKSENFSEIKKDCIEKLPNEMQESILIEDFSQWSNWTYKPEVEKEKLETDDKIIYKRFNFLPLNLHALLPRRNIKLISRDRLDEFPSKFTINYRHQNFDVRSCTKFNNEFRLDLQALKSMKVLNQINREFIVAVTKQENKRLLIVIDQHAMHERIRYENLLKEYKKDAKNKKFPSIILHRPIAITDFSSRVCNLLWTNRQLLKDFGLSLSYENENVLLINSVPRCFSKKTFNHDNAPLEIAVKKLLQEFINDLTNEGFKKILPFTIHEAIASEACHGSIKFGDPLTPEQCDILVSCWKETDAPNRCAHGRPSIAPLLELSSRMTDSKNDENLRAKDKPRREYPCRSN